MSGRALIRCDAKTVSVEVAEIHFRRGVARLGASFEETKCLGVILPNAAALEVKDAQVVKGRSVASIGGGMQPVQSSAGIRLRAPSGQRGHRNVYHRRRTSAARLPFKNLVRCPRRAFPRATMCRTSILRRLLRAHLLAGPLRD